MKIVLFLLATGMFFLPPVSAETQGDGAHYLVAAPSPEVPPSLEHYLFSPSEKIREAGKIIYLLQEIENSPCRFIRNGKSYAGIEAARHLKWKYSFSRDRIKTAREFLEHIADRSIKSGKPYRVDIEGRTYPLRKVLSHELVRLEHFMNARQAATV